MLAIGKLATTKRKKSVIKKIWKIVVELKQTKKKRLVSLGTEVMNVSNNY